MDAQASALNDDLRSGRVRSERGETLVEFALGLVLFLTILFGTIQFGLAVWQYNMISNLAQEGARWASVRGNGTLNAATRAQVEAFVQSRAPGMPGVTVDTYTADPSTKACTNTASDPNVLKTGDGICVWVRKPVSVFTSFFLLSGQIGAKAQMIIVR